MAAAVGDGVLLVAADMLDSFAAAADHGGSSPWAASSGGLGPGAGVVFTGAAADQARLWRAAALHPGARVAVLPEASAWLGEYLGALTTTDGDGRVALFVGACGGAGTTTAAALTAAAAARAGYDAVLVDADAAGAGLWPLLGTGPADGLTWEDTVDSHGRIPPQQLLEMLPSVEGLRVMTSLGGPGTGAAETFRPGPYVSRARQGAPSAPGAAGRLGPVLREVLAAAARAFEVVVVDGGRGVPQQVRELAHTTLHVIPAERVAQLGLGDGRLASRGGHAYAVVTGRLPTGADSPSIARHAWLPLAGHLPRIPAVQRAGADGRLLHTVARGAVARRIAPLLSVCAPQGSGADGPTAGPPLDDAPSVSPSAVAGVNP